MQSKRVQQNISGGANQNTMRVAQWMLQRPRAVTFFGCVGDDAMGAEMKRKAEVVGVRVVYQVDKQHDTGAAPRTLPQNFVVCGIFSHHGSNFRTSCIFSHWSFPCRYDNVHFFLTQVYALLSSLGKIGLLCQGSGPPCISRPISCRVQRIGVWWRKRKVITFAAFHSRCHRKAF